jgi:hypothetical protein
MSRERASYDRTNSGEDEILAQLMSSARSHGVYEDLPTLHTMLLQESRYDAQAKSPKGASGLMQLMPETASMLGVTDPNDWRQNIDAGVKYWALLKPKFGTDELTAAAYNAGPRRVSNSGGVPNIGETQHYVDVVTATPHDWPAYELERPYVQFQKEKPISPPPIFPPRASKGSDGLANVFVQGGQHGPAPPQLRRPEPDFSKIFPTGSSGR